MYARSIVFRKARGLDGVSATDPVSLTFSVLLLLAIALLAAAVPVRRALRVDPMDTLRAE